MSLAFAACASTPKPAPLVCPDAPVVAARGGYPVVVATSRVPLSVVRPEPLLSRADALKPWLGTLVRRAVPCPPGDDGSCRGYQEERLSLHLLPDHERRALLFEPLTNGAFAMRLVEIFDGVATQWCLPPAIDRYTGAAVTPSSSAVIVDVDATWGLAPAPPTVKQTPTEWDRCEGTTGHQRAVCECMRKGKPEDCLMP